MTFAWIYWVILAWADEQGLRRDERWRFTDLGAIWLALEVAT